MIFTVADAVYHDEHSVERNKEGWQKKEAEQIKRPVNLNGKEFLSGLFSASFLLSQLYLPRTEFYY